MKSFDVMACANTMHSSLPVDAMSAPSFMKHSLLCWVEQCAPNAGGHGDRNYPPSLLHARSLSSLSAWAVNSGVPWPESPVSPVSFFVLCPTSFSDALVPVVLLAIVKKCPSQN